jgi:hypothetical protein
LGVGRLGLLQPSSVFLRLIPPVEAVFRDRLMPSTARASPLRGRASGGICAMVRPLRGARNHLLKRLLECEAREVIDEPSANCLEHFLLAKVERQVVPTFVLSRMTGPGHEGRAVHRNDAAGGKEQHRCDFGAPRDGAGVAEGTG